MTLRALIADQGEVERAIGTVLQNDRDRRGSYLLLGTPAVRTWREGLSGSTTIGGIRENMADFKAYMRVDITPRHQAPKDVGGDG